MVFQALPPLMLLYVGSGFLDYQLLHPLNPEALMKHIKKLCQFLCIPCGIPASYARFRSHIEFLITGAACHVGLDKNAELLNVESV
jgi:hypothetical protein